MRYEYTKKRPLSSLEELVMNIKTKKDFNAFVNLLDELTQIAVLSEDDNYEYYNQAYEVLYGEPSDAYADTYDGSDENVEMENYYKIMNILTNASSRNNHKLKKDELHDLDYFSMKCDVRIEDVADANDCGGCETWQEIVDELAYQLSTGERVPN